MIDYSNIAALQAPTAKKRRGRRILALLVLLLLLCWHLAGSTDYPVAPSAPAPGPETVSKAQLAQIRANGRLLCLRGLLP